VKLLLNFLPEDKDNGAVYFLKEFSAKLWSLGTIKECLQKKMALYSSVKIEIK